MALVLRGSDTARRLVLSAGVSGLALAAAIAANATPVTYGASASFDGGTTGDYIVAPSGGDFTSVQAAVDAAVTAGAAGKTILVRAGTYREQVDISLADGAAGSPFTISRYGTEEPVISGAEVVTGWTVSNNSTVLGSTLAASGEVYEATIPTSTYTGPNMHGDPAAIDLHEAGERMQMAQARNGAIDDYTWGETATMFTADAAVMDGTNTYIVGLQDADFSAWTATQLTNAYALPWATPNIWKRCTIASFDGTDTITFGETDVQPQLTGGVPDPKYALLNILPEMQAGQWGFVDNGDSTITLYCRPTDPANLTANMEVSVRERGIMLGDASHVRLEGLTISQTASYKSQQGYGIGISTGFGTSGLDGTDLIVRHCTCKDQFVARGLGKAELYNTSYGGFQFQNYRNSILDHCSILNPFNHVGIKMAGHKGVGGADRCIIRFCHVKGTGTTAFSFYDVRNVLLHHTYLEDAVHDAHGSIGYGYNDSDGVVFYALKKDNLSGGYLTCQRSSRIYYGMCLIPASSKSDTGAGDVRSIVDQNDNTYTRPTVDSTNRTWNVTCPPRQAVDLTIGNSITLSTSVSDGNWSLCNSIFHGNGIDPGNGHKLFQRNNVLTNLLGFGWQTTSADIDATEDYVSGIGSTYTDYVNGDYSLVAGSTARTKAGEETESWIQTELLDDIFSWMDPADIDEWLGRDINGRRFTTTDFVGCDAQYRSADNTAPTLDSSTPADNATGVAVDATITLTFDKFVRAGTGNITIRTGGSAWETFDVASDGGMSAGNVEFRGFKVILHPSANFTSAASYSVQVDATAVESMEGAAFAGIADDTTLNFTVA